MPADMQGAEPRRAIARPSMWRLMLADLLLTLGPGTTGPLYVYYFHDAKGFNIAEVGYLLIFYIGAGLFGAPFWGLVGGLVVLAVQRLGARDEERHERR